MGEMLAKWLYKLLQGSGQYGAKILYHDAVREDLQTLEPAQNTAGRQKEYVIRKLSLCSMIVMTGVFLSAGVCIKETLTAKIVDNRLYRNEYGSGDKTVSLIAQDGRNTFQIPLELGERAYTMEELTNLSREVTQILEECILGQNQSLDKIEYDINLVKAVSGYPFEISWYMDEAYIDYEGRLVNNILVKPHMTQLAAKLSCESFVLEHTINLMVYSKAIQPGIDERIMEQITAQEHSSRTSSYLLLPSEIEGKRVNWHYEKSHHGIILLILTPIAALIAFYGKDKELRRRVAEREEQMLLDYPEVVSELALMIGAGMTVPNAWIKIAKDYKCRKDTTGKKRYAYEEMLLTVYEMESGVAQTQAYERFGRRCRIPRYNKLSAMLSQNIRKGAVDLPVLLKEEAEDAFAERKHMARMLGEKASTKLLVPMIMILGMIMMVIMVPAFQIYIL